MIFKLGNYYLVQFHNGLIFRIEFFHYLFEGFFGFSKINYFWINYAGNPWKKLQIEYLHFFLDVDKLLRSNQVDDRGYQSNRVDTKPLN